MLPDLSIRTRLTLVYAGVLFLTLVIAGVTGAWLLHERMSARMDAALALRLQGLEEFLRRETAPDATPRRMAEETLEYALTQPESHLIDVQDAEGRVLLKSDPVHGPMARRSHAFTLHGQHYSAHASSSLAPIDDAQHELLRLLWVSGPLLLAVAALSGYWLSGRAFAPVDAMTRTARGIGLTDLGQRVPVPPTRDELARLAEAWNEMLARLESSVGQVRRFTADAAHELRTPLSILRTSAELALRRPRDPEEYRQTLAEVVRTSQNLSQLVEGLLLLARGDAGSVAMVREPVNLAALGEEVARDVAPLFDARHVTLTVIDHTITSPPSSTRDPASGAPVVQGDWLALQRLLRALLENAARHTPAGGRVDVSVRVEDATRGNDDAGASATGAMPASSIDADARRARVVMEVRDTGSGIAPQHLSRIFERFYRADAARDRDQGGHGLGLAIAQQIARTHDGDISVSSTPGAGAVFRVSFPAAPREQTGADPSAVQ